MTPSKIELILKVSLQVFLEVAGSDKMATLVVVIFFKGESMPRSYGPGGFSDQYDNERFRSLDRDQNPGGVTGTPFEDEYDIDTMDFFPRHGEAYRYPEKRKEPRRDIDRYNNEHGHSGKGPKDWKLSDEKIRERVCEVLLHSHEVDATEMDVTVEDACVYLKGNISSRGMKRVAEDLVGSIPGVDDVFTELKIKNTSNFQLSDQALKEARNTDQS